jgi:demethylmenaquinone methyltransferase/2-methoxy-6-polyprenyl-1,4-benzoquinol methylase
VSAEPTRAPLPGTRPAGTRDEAEASRRVQEMFGRIAPRYDFLNHLLSLSLDRVWRRRTARRFAHIVRRPDARTLDLCCGTGDLTMELERAGMAGCPRQPGLILGSDFAPAMLTRAREKAQGRSAVPEYLAADALALPFADASFDLVTAAFGFRNLANYELGLSEIRRVLRPQGEVGILEFAEPEGMFRPLYQFYFEKILPRVGGALSGNTEAYAYLPGSVERFPRPEELRGWMEKAGLCGVRSEVWSLGIVALHTARRA